MEAFLFFLTVFVILVNLWLADQKGRDSITWFWLTIFFGPVATVMLLLMGKLGPHPAK
ncbi:hypothetical protein [Larkinella soli]|uniref:hypothetical protein n=1 Tax=Larkinella soli TaxID=1770527 RepID=UPI0013E3C914|nr:hypothetical protein [Larkinella soli]